MKQFRFEKLLTLKKEGVGVEDIDDAPVAPKTMLVLDDIAVEDETSALTYIRIGKVTAGRFRPWEEQKSPSAAEVVTSTEMHKMRDGEYFRCRVSGGAANDIIRVYLSGYWQYWSEP